MLVFHAVLAKLNVLLALSQQETTNMLSALNASAAALVQMFALLALRNLNKIQF
jgi:hypothetical protein